MSLFAVSRRLFHPHALAGLLVLIQILGWCGMGVSEIPRRTWRFAASGLKTVVIESVRARGAVVENNLGGSEVVISAQPAVAANGNHARELNEKDVSIWDWKFGWAETREPETLRLASEGETRLKHCHYVLEDLRIEAPPGVRVELRSGGRK